MIKQFKPTGNFSEPLPSYVRYAIGIEDYDEYYRDIHGITEKDIEVDKYYFLLDTDIIEGSGGDRMIYLNPLNMESNGIIPPNFIKGYELLQFSVYKK